MRKELRQSHPVRERMVTSAVFLLARDGYAGASFTAVLEHADAPRGSIYHHFPHGKDELVAAAIEHTNERVLQVISALGRDGLPELLDGFSAFWRGILSRTDCRNGCPVMAVSQGAADGSDVRQHATDVFHRWEESLAHALETAGLSSDRAGRIAVYLLTAYEGAVMMARAQSSIELFDQVHDVIKETLVGAS